MTIEASPRPRAAPSDVRGGVSRRALGPTVISRGLDQLVLGGATVWIATRMSPELAAPFLTLLILYALGGQLGDGGLALAILRTPATERLRTADARNRMVVAGVVAVLAAAIGLVLGGTTGVVLGAGAWTWVTASLAFVGRANLHRLGRTDRLALAEGGTAILTGAAIVSLVRDGDDLVVFAGLLVAKGLVETLVQGGWGAPFAVDGRPVQAGAEWLGQVATYAVANVDYLVIASLLTAADLSVYALAFRLASGPASVLAAPLTRSSFVGFADAPDHEATTRVARRVRRAAGGGGLAGLVAVAIIAVVLPAFVSDDWAASATIVLILAIALPWRLLLGPTVALAVTNRHAPKVIGWELTRLVLTAGLVAAGAMTLGLLGAAAAASIAAIAGITWAYERASRTTGLAVDRRLRVIAATAIVLAAVSALV